MIKNALNVLLLIGIVGLTTQCNPPQQTESATNEEATTMETDSSENTALYATLESVTDTLHLQDSLMIRFTVTNPTNDTLQFTQYHTPFEGFISNFLTITDGQGSEIAYMGPMAKRVMPPPADSYHTLAPGQSENVTFDLKKGYKIENTGTYTLQYNAENINGITNGEPLTITVVL